MSARWVSLRHPPPAGRAARGVALLASSRCRRCTWSSACRTALEPTSTTERRRTTCSPTRFGPGFNGPLTVVVDAPGIAKSDQKEFANAGRRGRSRIPGVAAVPPASNKPGDLTIVMVTPEASPRRTRRSDLVSDLRDKADKIPKTPESRPRDGHDGPQHRHRRPAERSPAALRLVVVGLALLLLTIVFRSLFVPLKATAGLHALDRASLGVVVWIFQDGNLAGLFNVAQPSPVLSFLPILLIGILFGLAMDYEVFLVSRMREHFVRTGNASEAVVTGYAQRAGS